MFREDILRELNAIVCCIALFCAPALFVARSGVSWAHVLVVLMQQNLSDIRSHLSAALVLSVSPNFSLLSRFTVLRYATPTGPKFYSSACFLVSQLHEFAKQRHLNYARE